MTIVLTGAGGMVGQAVLDALKASGRPVRVLSRTPAAFRSGAEVAALPGPDEAEAAFEAALAGATHLVHCAAANSDAGLSPEDMLKANGGLTGRLAAAASRLLPGRFVYLSSIRAVARPGWSGVIDEGTEPMPEDAYGRSKLAGERAVEAAYRGSDPRKVVLRPAPVYGPAMRGVMRALLRLADTPVPLPALPGTRPVLSLPALVRAILLALSEPDMPQPTYVVSDPAPLSPADIVGAYRRGLGRPARMVWAPAPVLGVAAALTGRRRTWQDLTAAQACDPSALMRLGWQAETDSRQALSDLARDLSRRGRI